MIFNKMASLMVGSHFNCFNYRDTWNVLENSWITHLILVLSLHRNCGYLLQLNAYEHECKDRPRTHILSRDAVGNWAFRLGFSARKDRDRDREGVFSFAAFNFVISSGRNHFILILFDQYTPTHVLRSRIQYPMKDDID